MHCVKMFKQLCFSSLPDFKPVFPRWEKQPMRKVRAVMFTCQRLLTGKQVLPASMGGDAVSLLSALLTYHPSKRITARYMNFY